MGSPTLNLALEDLPAALQEGIYACTVAFDGSGQLPAVMHYGPRPVFKDARSCEIHVLDTAIPSPPTSLAVTVAGRIRDVRNFPDAAALQERIREDIKIARGILGTPRTSP